jgi:DNA-binding transcriptional LysR family regulator
MASRCTAARSQGGASGDTAALPLTGKAAVTPDCRSSSLPVAASPVGVAPAQPGEAGAAACCPALRGVGGAALKCSSRPPVRSVKKVRDASRAGVRAPWWSVSVGVDVPIELRQLRYFVAVAEELHFGRAADRLHMSQSPLSRAIRELERDLGVVLFVRTTRQVELTPAGSLLLERARRALAEVDGAIAEVQRSVQSAEAVLRLGYGPFSGDVVVRIVDALGAARPELSLRLEQEVTQDSLRRVGAGELAAAVVMESPAAARRHGVRVDPLRDEPLVAALPRSHRYASEAAIPIGEFVADPVLLPREPPGQDVQRVAAQRDTSAWVRARADAGDRQRAVGSAFASGREWGGGGRDGGRVGAGARHGARRRAFRPAAELRDGPRLALAGDRGRGGARPNSPASTRLRGLVDGTPGPHRAATGLSRTRSGSGADSTFPRRRQT